MMCVSRTLFLICNEKLVIYHLDYASYCELNPFCIVRLKKKAFCSAFGSLWSLRYAVLLYVNHMFRSEHDIPIKEQIKTN